jgi:hypothetical protein
LSDPNSDEKQSARETHTLKHVPMTQSLHSYIIPAIFFVVFSVHFLSPVSQSADSRWTIHTAMSIVREHDTNLDEYESLIPPDDYRIEYFNGHMYSMFPIGTAVLITPILVSVDFFTTRVLQYDLVDGLKYNATFPGLEIFIGSLIVAFSAIVVYKICKFQLEGVAPALVGVFIFSFCTSAWSTASRALWQHGPSMLLLSIVLYLLLIARKNPSRIQFVSLPLAFAFVIRPTNSISIIVITVYVLLQYRTWFFRYVMWSLPITVSFLLFNYLTYHTFIPPYYFPNRIGTNLHFVEALEGNILSPSRGFIVYTPVALFAIANVVQRIRQRKESHIEFVLSVIIFLHWLSVSSFPHWWGGSSYGPRFFSDMIPYVVFLTIPSIDTFVNQRRKSSNAFRLIFAFALMTSFFMHFNGAVAKSTWEWNRLPVPIDEDPHRLWNWSDPQFMRLK